MIGSRIEDELLIVYMKQAIVRHHHGTTYRSISRQIKITMGQEKTIHGRRLYSCGRMPYNTRMVTRDHATCHG